MIKRIHFTKMHGAGNDYIYVNTLDCKINNPATLARQWSAPHTGIGSDGLVLIGASPIAEADFSMRIFNADGSEAMMCGNASRCIGKYLYEKGITRKTEIRLLTLSGIKTISLHIEDDHVSSVTVDMGQPALYNDSQFIASAAALPQGTFVSMGNPHYVLFTPEVDTVSTIGPQLECHTAFPQRCNIELAHIDPLTDASGMAHIRMRVWERGSGITMACGTGACATLVAAASNGLTPRKAAITMDGGTLIIEWSKDTDHVLMTGPAEFVYEGEIEFTEE